MLVVSVGAIKHAIRPQFIAVAANRHVRKKKSMAAQKTDNGTELVYTKTRKSLCNDVLLHLPNHLPRECLPPQEEMMSCLPFVHSPPKEKECEDAFL